MNPWIQHVREYAAKNKISYACAISEASKTYTKKTNKKETPKPTPEPKKEEPKAKIVKNVTNIFEFAAQEMKLGNDPIKISTEKRTSKQIQEDKKQANKQATKQSNLKARLTKKLFNPGKPTKEQKKFDKQAEEHQAIKIANLTPEEKAIINIPIFPKKKKSTIIL